jgi:hypothetical protein
MLLGEAKQEATAGSIIIGKQHQEANTRNNNTQQQHGAASGSNMRKQQHKATTGRGVNKNNKEVNNY